MKDRAEFQKLLENIIGSNQVYFQRPENLQMKYPAIVYSLSDIENTHANNTIYIQHTAYEVTVMDKNPDSTIAKKISQLPLCRFNRYYTADNLNHYVFKIYY